MDSKKIEELLQKYWDCETSLEEEQQLREYFRSEQVPEQLKETAVLFHYFDTQRNKTVDEHFEGTVVTHLKAQPVKKGKMVSLLHNSMRIAAGVAVLVAAVFFVRQEIRKNDTVAMEDTYDDPQKALEETKKALMMISKGFGRAEQQAKKINMINEAQETIQAKEDEKTEL
jgi:low affinity Fe/Cu permease